MAEDNAPTPPDRSRRAVILATVGIVVIMGLAILYVAVVAPMRHTHWVVRGLVPNYLSAQDIDMWIDTDECWGAVRELGGPKRAAERLQIYLSLPEWLEPDRGRAMLLLGWCGPAGHGATPILIEALSDEESDVRVTAIWALGRIGLEAEETVAALVPVLGDKDACGCARPLPMRWAGSARRRRPQFPRS